MLKDKSLDNATTKAGFGTIGGGGAAVAKPQPQKPEKEPPPLTDEQVLKAIQSLIGTFFTPAVKVNIEAITHRPVIGPGDLSTRELNPNRITLRTNAQGVIEGCSFG